MTTTSLDLRALRRTLSNDALATHEEHEKQLAIRRKVDDAKERAIRRRVLRDFIAFLEPGVDRATIDELVTDSSFAVGVRDALIVELDPLLDVDKLDIVEDAANPLPAWQIRYAMLCSECHAHRHGTFYVYSSTGDAGYHDAATFSEAARWRVLRRI